MTEAVLDLLWSLWTELGVPGTVRHHEDHAIDPEVLVVHTPWLARDEPRLLGLTFDWCCTNANRLSATRIAALAKAATESTRIAFAAFAADLARVPGGPQWRPREGTLGLEVDRLTLNVRPERPALVRLRLRVIVGVSTRAEVLASLLASPEGRTAAHLQPAGVSRPSVDRELAQLLKAGFTVQDGPNRGRRHELQDKAMWRKLLRAEGLKWTDWAGVFEVISTIDALRQLDPTDPRTRVAVPAVWDRMRRLAARIGVPLPPSVVGKQRAVEALVDWCATVVP